ncbi:MFS transporter [Clostridium tarantellae]|uniref:MFS transporter n=2 Tax=Clostridium tarantellae TaxID=39493 RepID=A0A6I1MQP5_9CLOT|nr:MFS transporter [Clostridium tarantellae]
MIKEKTKPTVISEIEPFSIKDKFGYMLGDLGNCMFFSFIGGYLMLFYTDVLGISAASVGSLFIIARIWDAINDPIMGTFVDSRPSTKTGKFRRYLLYFSVPVVASGFLCFTYFPGLSNSAKIIYAYVTYILFGMMFTGMSIPYGSLASVITDDPVQRTSLSMWRTIGYMLANLIIMCLAPKLVFAGGHKATAKGFMSIGIIFAIISISSYIGAFSLVKERIIHKNTKKPKINLKKSLKGLCKNRALLGIMLTSCSVISSTMLVNSLTPYLYKDYFKAPDLLSVAGMLGMGASFLVLPFVTPLAKKLGKKELASIGLTFTAITYLILFLAPITNPFIFISFQMIANVGIAFLNSVTWAMVADVIDYQEYITGKREEGIVYSSYSFVRKLGQAAAGGLGGFALTLIGYVGGIKEQSPQVALGIKRIATFAPLMAVTIAALSLMFVFNLSKKRLVEVTKELEKRRVS